MNPLLRLPPHEPAAKREECGIDRGPCNQDAKVKAESGVQIKEDGAAAFDDLLW